MVSLPSSVRVGTSMPHVDVVVHLLLPVRRAGSATGGAVLIGRGQVRIVESSERIRARQFLLRPPWTVARVGQSNGGQCQSKDVDEAEHLHTLGARCPRHLLGQG